MVIKRTGSAWVAVSTFEERLIPKTAGFRWHDPYGTNHQRTCPACTAGVGRAWWTDDINVACKLADSAEGEERSRLTAHAESVSLAKDASKAVDSGLDIPRPEGLEYMPFQKAGIAFVAGAMRRQAAGVLIGDEMGLGKTIQAIGAINLLGIDRVLIVCPASLKLNWRRELLKWLVRPLTVGIAEGKSWPDAQVVVANYDILSKHRARLQEEWPLVIVDECHLAKNAKALRTKALYGNKDGDGGVNARFMVAMSGTPIVNRPNELWTLLKRIDPRGLGRNWFYYHRDYCGAYRDRWGWQLGGATNLPILHEKLRGGVMVRRLKADVLAELPAKRRTVVTLPMSEEYEGLVSEEARRFAGFDDDIADAEVRRELALANDDKAGYEAAVRDLNTAMRAAFTEVSAMRHALAVAKVPAVLDYLESFNGSVKVVVFAHHHDVIDAIAEAYGSNAVKLDGRMPLEERQAAVDRFQADPDCNVFVGSIKAAGVGITLTAASDVVFAELDWVPGNISQAEDRCHRIGQRDSVNVIHLVVDGSIDARLASVLVAKQEVIDKALDRDVDLKALGEPVIPLRRARDVATRRDLDKDAEGMTERRCAAVLACLRVVARFDPDGAQERNDVGFNKIDVRIGHDLAQRGALTPKQAALGLRIIRKYHRQLPADLLAEAKGEAR